MYDTLINPVSVMVVFTMFVLLLSIFKPFAARIFTGFFFLAMALGVNLTVLLTNPAMIAATGAKAFFPVYRWFFTEVIAWNPTLWLVPLILFEAAVGLLILSKGLRVRFGLYGAIAFTLWLAPVGIEELATPLLALSFGLLLRKSYDRSVIELIAPLFHKRAVLS